MSVDLGISEKDRQMLQEEIHLVYHMAATIRFDEGIKKAILMNTRGTKYMVELCKGMKKLQVPRHM